MASPLRDATVFVSKGPGQDAGVHAALVFKLNSLGAKVCQRLTKDVTHIVFQRRTTSNSSAEERAAEEKELRSIHDRASKLEFPPLVVNTLWVSESESAGRRALERPFLLARPADPLCPLLVISPRAGGGSANKRRRAPAAQGRRVKATANLDVKDMLFSSSQQMHGDTTLTAALQEDTAQSPLPSELARKQQQHQTYAVGQETQAAADILHDMAAMAYLEPPATALPAPAVATTRTTTATTAGRASGRQANSTPAFADISNSGRGTGVAGTSTPLTTAAALAATAAIGTKRRSGVFKKPPARPPRTPVNAEDHRLPDGLDTAPGKGSKQKGQSGGKLQAADKAATPVEDAATAGATAGGTGARRRRSTSVAAAAAAAGDGNAAATAAFRSPAAGGSGSRAVGLSAAAARKSLGKANERRSSNGRLSTPHVTPEQHGADQKQCPAYHQAEEQRHHQHMEQLAEQNQQQAQQADEEVQHEHESAATFSFGAAAAGPSPSARAGTPVLLPRSCRRSRSAAPQQQGLPQWLVLQGGDDPGTCGPGAAAAAAPAAASPALRSITRRRSAAAAAAAAVHAATPPAGTSAGSMQAPASTLRRSARYQRSVAVAAEAEGVSANTPAAGGAMVASAVKHSVAAAIDAAAGPGSAAAANGNSLDAMPAKHALILPDSEEAENHEQRAATHGDEHCELVAETANTMQPGQPSPGPDCEQQQQLEQPADEAIPEHQEQQMVIDETDDEYDQDMLVDDAGNMHPMPYPGKPSTAAAAAEGLPSAPPAATAAAAGAPAVAGLPTTTPTAVGPSSATATGPAAAGRPASPRAPSSHKPRAIPAPRTTTAAANKRRPSNAAEGSDAMPGEEALPSLRGFKRPRLSAAALAGQQQQQQQQQQEEDEAAVPTVAYEQQAGDCAGGDVPGQQQKERKVQPSKLRQPAAHGTKPSTKNVNAASKLQPAATHKGPKHATTAAKRATKVAASPAAKATHTKAGKPGHPRAAASAPAKPTACTSSAPGASAAAAAAGPSTAAGVPASTQRYLSWTSVPGGIAELAKGAIKQLGGIKLCVEGHEEGKLSHLLVGDERRTLKVLIGVANGAWLLRPEWLTASLEKGEWLPEEPFQSTCRFAATAAAARAAQSQPSYKRPLEGMHVCIHCSGSAAAATGGSLAQTSEHKLSLQRLVRALGGRVVGPAAAALCVVSGQLAAPRGLAAGAKAVTEEWLLQLAENHVAPANERAYVVERK